MKCFHCGKEVIWQGDFDLATENSEILEGTVGVFECSNQYCSAVYECHLSATQVAHRVIFRKNTPKLLPSNLMAQLDWANTTLIGKTFKNKKTKGIYYVKGITIDTETLELRVIYVDGISINEWDRPLPLFIEKFEEYKGGLN